VASISGLIPIRRTFTVNDHMKISTLSLKERAVDREQ
jgi:hypothetical protein